MSKKTCLLPRNRSGTVGSQNRQKVLFGEKRPLKRKSSKFPMQGFMRAMIHVFLPIKVSWKSVQLKLPKRCVIAYFCVILLRGLCSDSAVNFIGSLFPQPGRSDTKFRPNTSNFLEDNRESVVWRHYSIGMKLAVAFSPTNTATMIRCIVTCTAKEPTVVHLS